MSAEVSAALIVALLLEELRIGPPEVRDHKFSELNSFEFLSEVKQQSSLGQFCKLVLWHIDRTPSPCLSKFPQEFLDRLTWLMAYLCQIGLFVPNKSRSSEGTSSRPWHLFMD
ncbi:unnamed protein product [Prunus armeniaca]|uniref:Uncharacterized protein n=1 Tax=Prunus armeniaca TaxID=36596 RepID=A0A6J5THT5_PRUAR|nr:unnamed protein product [Prunus armeniaca]